MICKLLINNLMSGCVSTHSDSLVCDKSEQVARKVVRMVLFCGFFALFFALVGCSKSEEESPSPEDLGYNQADSSTGWDDEFVK